MPERPEFYTEKPKPTGYDQPATLDDLLIELRELNAKIPDLVKIVAFMTWSQEAMWADFQTYGIKGDFARGAEWAATNKALEKWTQTKSPKQG